MNDVDSAAVSIFVVILVELTNTVFVNSTNMTTNIETAVPSREFFLPLTIFETNVSGWAGFFTC